MNTVKDLREALAEDMRRLQPRPGLESRILQQALGGFDESPSSGASSRRSIRSRAPRRRVSLTAGARAAGAIAAVLIVLLIMLGILVGGRVFRDFGLGPAGRPSHALPRAESGMVSSTTGWMGGFGQPLQRTTDGGVHWADVGPLSYVPSPNDTTYFLDATHAWLTVFTSSGQVRFTTFRTVDGGKTWHRGEDMSAVGGQGRPYPRLYFLDTAHGWLLLQTGWTSVSASDNPNPVTLDDAMYGTADGGHHWTLLSTNVHAEGAGCDWKTAAFASVSDGWLTVDCAPPDDSQIFLSTHDRGKTWSPQELRPPAAGLVCPCGADPITVFDRENAAILVRGAGTVPIETRVFFTADGGNSWTARRLPGASQLLVNSFPGVVFIDPKHGWTVAGPSDVIEGVPTGAAVPAPLYRTDDGGLTWVPVVTNLTLADLIALETLYFVDLEHGFIHGPRFLKTEDGGHHWKAVVPTADDCPTTLSSTCKVSPTVPRR